MPSLISSHPLLEPSRSNHSKSVGILGGTTDIHKCRKSTAVRSTTSLQSSTEKHFRPCNRSCNRFNFERLTWIEYTMITVWLSIGTQSLEDIPTYRIYHCVLILRQMQVPTCADRDIFLLSTCWRNKEGRENLDDKHYDRSVMDSVNSVTLLILGIAIVV